MRSLCYLEGGCLKKPLNTRKTCSVGLTRNFTLAQGDNSVQPVYMVSNKSTVV